MSEDLARRLAIEQRKRLVASLMEHLEREVYPAIPKPKQVALRQKVLDAIGTYHDFVLDVLKVSRDDVVQNDETLRLLTSIHNGQRRLESSLNER